MRALLPRDRRGLRPATFWIFTAVVDAAYVVLTARGADVVEQVHDTPRGLRQFTVRDLHGNIFHLHPDL